MLRAEHAQRLYELERRPHEIHVAGDGLQHDGGDAVPVLRECVGSLLRVVVVEDEGVRGELGWWLRAQAMRAKLL